MQDTPPFSRGYHPDVALSPAQCEKAGFYANAYQVWLWFAMYCQRRDAVEAAMLRDHFYALLDRVAGEKGFGAQVSGLFEAPDRAPNSAHHLTHARLGAAAHVEVSPEYRTGMHQLPAFPRAPRRAANMAIVEEDARRFGQCVQNAKINAQDVIVPMLEFIHAFDPTQIRVWQWAATMGAKERHLQRRHKNSLFPRDRREVSALEVYTARVADQTEREEASETLAEIQTELQRAELSVASLGVLNTMRKRIESVSDRIDKQGRHSKDLKARATVLRQSVVGSVLERYTDNVESYALIENAEKLYAEREARFDNEWLHATRGPGSTIPKDEIGPSVLSERNDDIRRIVALHEADKSLHSSLQALRSWVEQIVRQARENGDELSEINEKLSILGVAV